jgi:hypothetical protein
MAFDAFYLRRHHFENGGLFYDVDPCPDGPHHDALSIAIHEHNRVVGSMPRGFGKSTDIVKTMMLRAFSANGWNISYCTSTHKIGKRFFIKMMQEIETNPYLRSDYQIGHGAPPNPSRSSSRPWSSQDMSLYLSNGSSLDGMSVDGAIRAGRPHDLFLDDPEKDARGGTDMAQRRQYLETLIFKVMGPMIRDPRRLMAWTGTRISRRHYLWSATTTDPNTGTRLEPRFSHWRTLAFQAAYPSATDMREALWPSYMPLSEIRLEIQRLGLEFVMAEYFNEPGAGTALIFQLSPDHHSWDIPSLPDLVAIENPRTCQDLITYRSETKGTQSIPFCRFLDSCLICTVVDWGASLGPTADPSAVTTLAMSRDNEIFVLDCWEGRKSIGDVSNIIIDQTRRFKPRAILLETAGAQAAFQPILSDAFRNSTTDYKPFIHAVNSRTAKSDRIAALGWRIGTPEHPRPLLKIPFRNQNRPHWSSLSHQISNFNPFATDCGLDHDDLLDTISIFQEGVPQGSRMSEEPPTQSGTNDDAVEMLLAGHRDHPKLRVPLIGLINFGTLPRETLDAIMVALDQPPKDSTNAVSRSNLPF